MYACASGDVMLLTQPFKICAALYPRADFVRVRNTRIRKLKMLEIDAILESKLNVMMMQFEATTAL